MLPEKCICSQETVKMKIEQETEMACKLGLESLFADKSVTECELCQTELGNRDFFPPLTETTGSCSEHFSAVVTIFCCTAEQNV